MGKMRELGERKGSRREVGLEEGKEGLGREERVRGEGERLRKLESEEAEG